MDKLIKADQLVLEPVQEKKPEAHLAPTKQVELIRHTTTNHALAQAADEDDFDWDIDDSIILREQRATAAYRNPLGELVIRQKASWCDDRDTIMYISPENEVAFIEGLVKRARED